LIFSVLKSATTSRAGDMRMAPGRGRGHALPVAADFKNSFLDLIRSGACNGLDTTDEKLIIGE